MAKEVKIKLTDDQKAKIKKGTGQDLSEIRVSAVGANPAAMTKQASARNLARALPTRAAMKSAAPELSARTAYKTAAPELSARTAYKTAAPELSARKAMKANVATRAISTRKAARNLNARFSTRSGGGENAL